MRKIWLLSLVFLLLGSWSASAGEKADAHYQKWVSVGKGAAKEALKLMAKGGLPHGRGTLIAMSNAGYAEVNSSSTQPALDGLAQVTGASRGRNTLVEVHSDSQAKLWFAVYDPKTGACAYLQVDENAVSGSSAELFSIHTLMRIDADYLFANVPLSTAKFKEKPFAGNEFRIITIANAIARGVSSAAVRAFEFHDHYCPGVSSGILMVSFIKKYFPHSGSGYFVQAVNPWCKVDAMLVLLNATPGKIGYAVTYPSDADKAKWKPEAKNAATIVYRQNDKTKRWEGRVFGFDWVETSCPKTENGVIDKLCADLWYLDRMDAPEKFVQVIKEFELPEGVTPKDWARPGVDPMANLQLIKD